MRDIVNLTGRKIVCYLHSIYYHFSLVGPTKKYRFCSLQIQRCLLKTLKIFKYEKARTFLSATKGLV